MKPSTLVQPDALFDARGRARLAELVIYGSRGKKLNREQIRWRLVKVLERIARKLESKSEIGKAA